MGLLKLHWAVRVRPGGWVVCNFKKILLNSKIKISSLKISIPMAPFAGKKKNGCCFRVRMNRSTLQLTGFIRLQLTSLRGLIFPFTTKRQAPLLFVGGEGRKRGRSSSKKEKKMMLTEDRAM